ncbi:hypothetical protein SERLADRAFT_405888 [Serpula lacrymans var. lacrymans S7.9]|uniref:Uncharacterized protein n=1 Tax=Serpula lacrymans var. lacrymans (strain S7.9) TaxID=578457 RepID=F8NJR7_SERL9|nr:uncharacterized protein SERLADRAFT_405888 [Serpula lacrymans var. lacrymans S7.9]EGO28282.1 hypothetical protein SERLADRAFT_405888 [Serpula lacrymans var. lacrymans S7.9]
MTVVLSKKAKRTAPSWCSPSPPPVPGPSRPSHPQYTHPHSRTSNGQCPDPIAPPTGKGKGKARVVIEITRGVEDLQRKSMEEGYKQCRLDKSICTISRSKQMKKWRTSYDGCSQEMYKCVWDNDASLGSKSRNPKAPGALVTAPDHPVKTRPPRGAHKLVYQPHRMTWTQFTIRVPPAAQAVIPAPAHRTPPPATRPLPPPQMQFMSQESRRPLQMSHRESREMDANAIHSGPDLSVPPPFLLLALPVHLCRKKHLWTFPAPLVLPPCLLLTGLLRSNSRQGPIYPWEDLINFSFMSPTQQWSPPPSLEERVARIKQRQGIIRDPYESISKLEDEVARLKAKERDYN